MLSQEQIHQNTKLVDSKYIFYCPQCKAVIQPQLKTKVGDSPENQRESNTEQVELLHPVTLRNNLEDLFQIDVNYMKV